MMDIVNDGYIEPDVIWLWDNSAGMTGTGIAAGSSPNHHIGIYIGTYFDGQPHAYPWVDEASPTVGGIPLDPMHIRENRGCVI